MGVALRTVYLPTDQGHGNARRSSLKNCRNELVALMDASDISLPYKFAKKLIIFKQNIDVEKNYPPFSVAMCVYGGDNPVWFDAALESIINQTVKPSEIVLVVDGPIPDSIQGVIDKYTLCEGALLKVIRLEINSGHGIARRVSLENCSNEIVALMDSDDICVSSRFEEELRFFEDSDADVVGGNIAEFINDINNIVGYRIVPETDAMLKQYIKKRCPFNQMTVMFRKSIYNEAGGYLDWYCDEDYYLWLRMMLKGAKFANTGTVLVNVRVGKEMYQRRGGIHYFKSEEKLQEYMLKHRIIRFPTFVTNVIIRLIVQVLMPNEVRGFIFQKFAREKRG